MIKNQENQKSEPAKREPQKPDFHRRNPNPQNNNNNQGHRNQREANPNRDKEATQGHGRESREQVQNRPIQRESQPRQNYSYPNSQGKYNNRVKTVETVEDIKADIIRIEKEIDLEIKEIKTMRLGL